MLTVLEVIKKTTDYFAARGIESARLNAELLIGHALGRKRMQLYMEFERPLTETELDRLRPMVRRRAQHEPLQYVMGETEFFGLKLKVDRRALIPRPETEQLVEQILAAGDWPARALRVLDLGTGSGAIALALATRLPEARVTATDLSGDALDLARENAVRCAMDGRVTFLQSDWFACVLDGPYDIIVANPPYLSADEVAQTGAEVREFEPPSALVAADQGSADLKKIISDAPRFMARGALLALETGIAQHELLITHAARAGFPHVESRRDLTQRDRFIFATL